jgi:hypothetical protein
VLSPVVGTGAGAAGATGAFFLHPTPSAAIKTITPITPWEFILSINLLSNFL